MSEAALITVIICGTILILLGVALWSFVYFAYKIEKAKIGKDKEK